MLPVFLGCAVGTVCGLVSLGRWCYLLWLGSAAVFGFAATVLTGEWRFGWEFVILDTSLVAASAFAAVVLGYRIKRHIPVPG
jgi:hypothetical protein